MYVKMKYIDKLDKFNLTVKREHSIINHFNSDKMIYI